MQYIDEKFKIEIYIIHKMLSTSLTKVSSPTALLLCCPFFLKANVSHHYATRLWSFYLLLSQLQHQIYTLPSTLTTQSVLIGLFLFILSDVRSVGLLKSSEVYQIHLMFDFKVLLFGFPVLLKWPFCPVVKN